MQPLPSRFARVIVDRSADKEFDYLIPDSLAGRVQVGSRVRLPFRNRASIGTVVDLPAESPVPENVLRPLNGVIGDKAVISPVLIDLARWMADYYCCPVETAMRSVLPQVIRDAELTHKTQLFARLLRPPTAAELAAIIKKAPRQAEILAALAETSPQPVAALCKQCGATHATIQSLVKAGLVATAASNVDRDPYENETFIGDKAQTLSDEQTECMRVVRASMDAAAEERKPVLLHGVTGSGKTEVYLQSISYALERGQTALVLVPEISLTPQTVERFKSRFQQSGHDVAVLHSHLSDGERHDEWHKIHGGKARIVIGARSAVFAPLANLGLIVVDEEHETSYKQEEAPRYQARDIAVLRARMEGCTVVLGSATPSIESFHNAQTGKYDLAQLTQRVDDRQLPRIRVVDLRQEAQRQKSRNGPLVLSEKLRAAITVRLEKKEQTILFLNRRGFATSLVCPACGHVCKCVDCSVSLTFHRAANRLVCHLCGHQASVPRVCPNPMCQDPQIRQAGLGTERVEDVITKVFPQANIRRMDADAMTRKDAFKETLHAFRQGKIDILIGTQMIAKGLHFPNVTLVGIINADLALHLPDFRAGERTFQLLTQVAGRAGRGEMEGEVFVQSFTPFSPSIQFARHHDFDGYFHQELDFRHKCEFPPFVHLVLLTIKCAHQERGKFSTETLHRRLKENLPEGATLGDPVPAPLERLKTQYRYHLLLRGRSAFKLSRHVKAVLGKLQLPVDVAVAVDVDPYQLL